MTTRLSGLAIFGALATAGWAVIGAPVVLAGVLVWVLADADRAARLTRLVRELRKPR